MPIQTLGSNRWWSLSISLLLAILTFVAFDQTDLDEAISNLFFDPASQTFVLEHSALFERVTHQWAKSIPSLFTAAAITGLVLAGVWALLKQPAARRLHDLTHTTRLAPLLSLSQRHARDCLYFLCAFAFSATAVHYFKSHTSVYCPVETTLYGGTQPHFLWFNNFNLLHKPGAGRCWPGGHASGAFSLMALYFIARHHQWRHARKVLVMTLTLGMLFGSTRVLQGWHYMSHTFWAGLVVWWCCELMSLAFYRKASATKHQAAHEALLNNQR